MYKAAESIYKQAVREELYRKVTDHVPVGGNHKFVTLSNTAFWLEKSLTSRYASKATCYEMDKKVFSQISNMNLPGIQPVLDNLFNYSDSEPVSFAWLDFCNSYTDNLMTKIADLVNKMVFAERSVLSITLNKKRGQRGTEMALNKHYPNYKDEGFATHMAQFIQGNVQKVERMQYICSDICTRGAFMNVFTFFITK